ncbi:MAG TPA: thiopeptide-type bacteriocin biosynthesis protein, partial [Rhizomicrobium sp.]|nr:thiopeptide-type bacteriocin biosynthesis protein [Rhizomicrobium sp.]
MKTIVFLGPTLPVSVARQYLDATFLPPVEQGDVLRALKDRPDAIGIIDGYFQRVPSVWHKEILTAIAEGVHVAGAASMGALRAAELAAFGMVGIGSIFSKFHSGEYTDDDEVAVAHASAELGYRALSEAMVNIRACCAEAIEAGVVSSADAQIVVKVAKALHFTGRHWEAILAGSIAAGMDPTAAQDLRLFRTRMPQGAKERDAVALLQHLATLDTQACERPRTPLRVHQTAFLADLKQQINRETVPDPEEAPPTSLNVARKKVLLGALANREAVRRGLMIGHDDVNEMTGWFRGAYSLEDDDRFVTWKANHALAEPDFAFAMRRFTSVVRVEEACRPEIDAELDTYLKVYSAAAQNHSEAPVWVQLNIGLGRGAEGAQASARALFGELMPVMRRLNRRGAVDCFHFVRKAPDLRLRFRAVAPDETLLPRLAKLFQKLCADGVIASVARSVYEPEARVFGGAAAMDAVHDYFDADSRGWILWNETVATGHRVAAEQMCTTVIDDLFHSVLGCPSEVWDAWNNLCHLTREAKVAAAKLNNAVPAGADPNV